ncbi:hypothetical protein ARMGADRAFT_1069485 [Armillaria gallica]|uniref:Uncharacterized protein n=1 Tax=Armillaria gallica TaxID=47427 RepID=A0A2H3CT39_ARMGA|nr:hypothetical protein ARMGADRAFT_1069485 [Armillaria gallica]
MTTTYSIHSLLCYPSTMLVSAIPSQYHNFGKFDERIPIFGRAPQCAADKSVPVAYAMDFEGGMADDVLKRVLGRWCRSLSILQTTSTVHYHYQRGRVHACSAIDKGDGPRFYRADKRTNRNRRAEETGDGAFATMDAYCTDASGFSSALAVHLYFIIPPLVVHFLTMACHPLHASFTSAPPAEHRPLRRRVGLDVGKQTYDVVVDLAQEAGADAICIALNRERFGKGAESRWSRPA